MSDQSCFRETTDDYLREIIRYKNHRIILCKDCIQWIVQRAKPVPDNVAQPRWRAVGYYATKDALMRHWDGLQAASAPTEIAALPDYAHHCALIFQTKSRN